MECGAVSEADAVEAVSDNFPQKSVSGSPLNGAPLTSIRTFLVFIELERNIQYYSKSKLNNATHFVVLQDLRAGLLPSLYHQIVSTMLFFLLRYFFPAREMLSFAQVIANAIAFANTALFSTCDWAMQNWSVFVTNLFL